MSDHQYVSTACQHDLHDRCRKVCKFCDAMCGCVCHVQVATAGDVAAVRFAANAPTDREDYSEFIEED